MTADTIAEKIAQIEADWSQRFPARFNKPQKERFLAELEKELAECGFEPERFTLGGLVKNRLLVTHCAQPQAIFMAHYDTATIMPAWLAWLSAIFGHTRQLEYSVVMVVTFLAIFRLLPAVLPSPVTDAIVLVVGLALIASSLPFLIPNPRNREDNTSGVLGLIALAHLLKDQPELRSRVQLAFMDNEEWGLFGSQAIKNNWDRQGYPYQQAALISLDCIARGRKPLVAYHKQAKLAQRLLPFIQKRLPEAVAIDMGWLPLSDNYTFRQVGAVDISFGEPSKLPGGYFIPRIHSPRDNDFSMERFFPLIQGLEEFLQSSISS